MIQDPPAKPVHIKSGIVPKLIAYRDGFVDATSLQPVAWKIATPALSTDIMVRGSYSVAVVCQLDANTVLTWQGFHTLDETPEDKQPGTVETGCQLPPTLPVVTGALTQSGRVHIGDADAQTTGATNPFPFTLQVAMGTYELVATTANADPSTNKTLIQGDIMVPAAGGAIGTFDVANGAAHMPITALALSNPPDPEKSTEKITASIEVATKSNTAATISSAEYDLTAEKDETKVTVYALAKAAIPAGATQFVTFTGRKLPKDAMVPQITTTRSISKPLTVGDDTSTGKALTGLPGGITIPAWGMDKTRLTVALPSLPALDDLTLEARGKAAGAPATSVRYMINITADYLNATTLARPVFDTDITGFDPTWKIDFNQAYSRTITSQHDTVSMGKLVSHESAQFDEQVPAAH